jgi:hypothetical protein
LGQQCLVVDPAEFQIANHQDVHIDVHIAYRTMFQPLPQFYDPVAQILLADFIGLTSLEDVKEFPCTGPRTITWCMTQSPSMA